MMFLHHFGGINKILRVLRKLGYRNDHNFAFDQKFYHNSKSFKFLTQLPYFRKMLEEYKVALISINLFSLVLFLQFWRTQVRPKKFFLKILGPFL
jgi:hypothetical protein